MEHIYTCVEDHLQLSSGAELHVSIWKVSGTDRWQQSTYHFGTLAGLCAALLLAGCQAGTIVPFSVGPPLDNLFGLLILLAVGTLLYRAIVPGLRRSTKSPAVETAESVARERYARGEITREQLQEIVSTLSVR